MSADLLLQVDCGGLLVNLKIKELQADGHCRKGDGQGHVLSTLSKFLARSFGT